METIKMRSTLQLVLFLLIFQACTNAAPSELLQKLENIAKIEYDSKDTSNSLIDVEKNDSGNTENSQREKRFYNYYGYGFPPINPVIYPSYPRRDDYPGYVPEDHFAQIYRRLQDIATVIRQPTAPPPPQVPQYPLFYPVIYIPFLGCGCTPDQYPPTDNRPPSDKRNDTELDISNRWPDMDDDRQNWGFVVNNTEEDDGQEEDFTRPISFEPIKPNRTMSRPPPPVEHGTSQAGQPTIDTNTTGSIPPASSMQNNPTTIQPLPERPSACDVASLSCCHQTEVTYDCFILQGCPGPAPDACEPQAILRVIERFQRLYGPRNG